MSAGHLIVNRVLNMFNRCSDTIEVYCKIVISMNSSGRSFHTVNKAAFSLAILVGFGVYL